MDKSLEMHTYLKLNSPVLKKKVDLCFCSMLFAECWLLDADNKLFVSAKWC